ncbi:YwhD-like protein [Salsuginibacillus halophilus]|uniref:YwhD-like protein n=1 Tax=Salsuginibacillus halophilus TaxID=517424 RepID=A0A2P8HI09_9BACI|nr:YwhD family protein [Salsuginibacillus halophilus]PSL45864.1 YwhD-like protein [Salsuginibacillus halophilus]
MDIFGGGGKSNKQFNILSGDSTDGHGGYGAGTFNLDNMTPVIIDPVDERVFIDMGALHARSEIEKRIKMLKDINEVPNARRYWIVWVTTEHNEGGEPYYHGAGACAVWVDREIRRGYKSMPEHVNNMDKAMKGHIIVEHMDDESRKYLGEYLKAFNEELWDRAAPEFREALT